MTPLVHSSLARHEVLLVEDNEDHALLVAAALRKSKRCKLVHHVTDLHGALTWLAEHQAAAVLLDLSLPDSQGLQTVRSLRSSSPISALIVLTAYDDDRNARLSLAIGAQDYLLKQSHLSTAVLERAIVYAIERQRFQSDMQQFVSAAAHDIQAPIRQIKGFAKMLLDRYGGMVPEDGQRQLRFIDNSAQHLGRMVRSLLQYARVGAHTVDAAAVNVQRVVERVQQTLYSDLASVGAQLDTSDLSHVHAEEGLLESLLQNLVDNAIKYRSTSRPLQIKVQQVVGQGAQTLVVSDNGQGIAPENLERIWLPFARVAPPEHQMATPLEGVGLGLALCRRILEVHHGHMSLTSEVDEGTTIQCTFPDIP